MPLTYANFPLVSFQKRSFPDDFQHYNFLKIQVMPLNRASGVLNYSLVPPQHRPREVAVIQNILFDEHNLDLRIPNNCHKTPPNK